MNYVLDFVNIELNEVMDAQEMHLRKVTKENSVFRKRLLEMLGNEKPESINKILKSLKVLIKSRSPSKLSELNMDLLCLTAKTS